MSISRVLHNSILIAILKEKPQTCTKRSSALPPQQHASPLQLELHNGRTRAAFLGRGGIELFHVWMGGEHFVQTVL